MGYTTFYIGKIELDRQLPPELILELEEFSQVYHEKEIYTGSRSEWKDQQLPSQYCQWVPSVGGTALVWDRGDKFYGAKEWIHWLAETYLSGYDLNGLIYAIGEESGDIHTLKITHNVCAVTPGLVDLSENQELMVELINYVKNERSSKDMSWLYQLCGDTSDLEGFIIDVTASIEPIDLYSRETSILIERIETARNVEGRFIRTCQKYLIEPSLEGWELVEDEWNEAVEAEEDMMKAQSAVYDIHCVIKPIIKSDSYPELDTLLESAKVRITAYYDKQIRIYPWYRKCEVARNSLPHSLQELVSKLSQIVGLGLEEIGKIPDAGTEWNTPLHSSTAIIGSILLEIISLEGDLISDPALFQQLTLGLSEVSKIISRMLREIRSYPVHEKLPLAT